jgi:pimeloyl-ACP methyl ester carboxylesterase
LLSSEYHAFALTQRGHGDSDKPQCCYTLDDFAADVDAFMDALGIEEATLVGASTGALFAQRVALSYPHRVSRLVLVGAQTPANEANEAVMGLQEEVRALEDPVPPEFVRAFQESTIYQPVPQEFLDTVVSESLKLPARVWRDYLEGAVLSIDHDYVLALGEIDVLTLILWGEQDPLFPRKEQERLAAAIPGATLKVYPDTGHAVHWDRPEWVVRDLEEFMKRRAPPASSSSQMCPKDQREGGIRCPKRRQQSSAATSSRKSSSRRSSAPWRWQPYTWVTASACIRLWQT